MALPTSGYLSDPDRTVGEMQQALEDQRDFIVGSTDATAGTNVVRDSNGTFKIGAPTDPAHPAQADYVGGYVIAEGSAVFTNSTNSINLTGIGIGVEVGDVITITGSTSNNKEFTIEVVTDNDNVIVNQAHAGGTTSKSLVNETATVTVALLCKWYLAPLGLGQGWVDVSGSRVSATLYSNPSNRTIGVKVNLTDTWPGTRILAVGGADADRQDVSSIINTTIPLSADVPAGADYSINASAVTVYWAELR